MNIGLLLEGVNKYKRKRVSGQEIHHGGVAISLPSHVIQRQVYVSLYLR